MTDEKWWKPEPAGVSTVACRCGQMAMPGDVICRQCSRDQVAAFWALMEKDCVENRKRFWAVMKRTRAEVPA